jgi:hypothetical protein
LACSIDFPSVVRRIPAATLRVCIVGIRVASLHVNAVLLLIAGLRLPAAYR